jgi:hypothetical protein
MDGPTPAPGWEFNITIINEFQCPYAGEIRGLDYVDGETAVTFASDPDNMLYTCNANDGAYIGELVLGFSNPHPFGLCYDANGNVHVNEFNGGDIYWYNGGWNEYANPSSNKGSGMDFDGDYIWETYWTDGVYRFFPDGSGAEFYETSEVGAQLSGLTVFPYNGNLFGFDIHSDRRLPVDAVPVLRPGVRGRAGHLLLELCDRERRLDRRTRHRSRLGRRWRR